MYRRALYVTLGKGTQPFPWIHINDMVGILIRVIDDTDATGRFNAVAPGIVNNADFTAAGQLRVARDGDDRIVQGDRNGDGEADFAIVLLNAAGLGADDFIL